MIPLLYCASLYFSTKHIMKQQKGVWSLRACLLSVTPVKQRIVERQCQWDWDSVRGESEACRPRVIFFRNCCSASVDNRREKQGFTKEADYFSLSLRSLRRHLTPFLPVNWTCIADCLIEPCRKGLQQIINLCIKRDDWPPGWSW